MAARQKVAPGRSSGPGVAETVRFSSDRGSPFGFSFARERDGTRADDDADALGTSFALEADGNVVSSAGAASIRTVDGAGADEGGGIAGAEGLAGEPPAKEAAMTADLTGDPTRRELASLPGV